MTSDELQERVEKHIASSTLAAPASLGADGDRLHVIKYLPARYLNDVVANQRLYASERGQHRLFFSPVELCDNLIFRRRAALDQMGERLLDANRTIGQPSSPPRRRVDRSRRSEFRDRSAS